MRRRENHALFLLVGLLFGKVHRPPANRSDSGASTIAFDGLRSVEAAAIFLSTISAFLMRNQRPWQNAPDLRFHIHITLLNLAFICGLGVVICSLVFPRSLGMAPVHRIPTVTGLTFVVVAVLMGACVELPLFSFVLVFILFSLIIAYYYYYRVDDNTLPQ